MKQRLEAQTQTEVHRIHTACWVTNTCSSIRGGYSPILAGGTPVLVGGGAPLVLAGGVPLCPCWVGSGYPCPVLPGVPPAWSGTGLWAEPGGTPTKDLGTERTRDHGPVTRGIPSPVETLPLSFNMFSQWIFCQFVQNIANIFDSYILALSRNLSSFSLCSNSRIRRVQSKTKWRMLTADRWWKQCEVYIYCVHGMANEPADGRWTHSTCDIQTIALFTLVMWEKDQSHFLSWILSLFTFRTNCHLSPVFKYIVTELSLFYVFVFRLSRLTFEPIHFGSSDFNYLQIWLDTFSNPLPNPLHLLLFMNPSSHFSLFISTLYHLIISFQLFMP